MSLRELLINARREFESLDIPAIDSELLLAHTLGVTRMELHSREFTLTSEQEAEFLQLIADRKRGIPTQYLIGKAPFRYLEFDVGPGVLIPRPETEMLVDAVLDEVGKLGRTASVVDLGSGSGAIAISIAIEAARKGQAVTVVAVENDPKALEWLRRNIARHEVDIRVVAEDVERALIDVRADIVVANPPYIPLESELPELVKDHEPHSALFGGAVDGFDIPRRFIAAATRILKPEGFLVIEHYEKQRAGLEAELGQDYRDITSYLDLN
ncbi:MAG: peptide chain release factor N(5)-glutamine methyltransferase, partial [Actinobacteria bacterium]|nr:peptide chain release factor N(5)-glutamine methyltransferase [Actinomycetota bacterium]